MVWLKSEKSLTLCITVPILGGRGLYDNFPKKKGFRDLPTNKSEFHWPQFLKRWT